MLRTSRACAVALLICVGGAGAVLPNYKVSTRLFTHSNDNGQDQAAMHVGDPGTRGFKDPAQTLNPKVKSDSQRAADAASTLVQSITTVGVEGWTTALADNRPASVTLGADIGKGVVGSDKSGESWYFLAPADKFSGDLSRAYNGRLQLSLVHAETPASGSVRREPDVILEATCGHSLMLYNFAAKVRQFCCARPPRAVPWFSPRFCACCRPRANAPLGLSSGSGLKLMVSGRCARPASAVCAVACGRARRVSPVSPRMIAIDA